MPPPPMSDGSKKPMSNRVNPLISMQNIGPRESKLISSISLNGKTTLGNELESVFQI